MYYQEVIEELKKIILPILEEDDIELVELSFARSSDRAILKLLVDKKYGGIDLQECARLNEKIGNTLDAQSQELNRYILEVSSPGLDRPLRVKSDFLRCINRKARFFLSESIKGKIEHEGAIIKVEQDSVYIDIDGDIVEIPLVKIKKAKQILE